MKFLVLAALLLGGCATTQASQDDFLDAMLSGRSAVQDDELARRIAQAEAHPLGSEDNPVRVSMPVGQRAYLGRLRCANLKAPEFERLGSAGTSPFGNIMDIYAVRCADSEPAEREVYMDMYHPDHFEARPIEGFGISGGRVVSED